MTSRWRRYITAALMMFGPEYDAGAAGAPGTCVGRYTIAAGSPINVSESEFVLYWGEVRTYREGRDGYEARLREALSRAQREGGIIERSQSIVEGRGALFVRQEELGYPYDPNASEVVGLVNVRGITVEYRKRTINRLRGAAKDRARQILAAADARAGIDESEFCAGGAVLAMPRRPGWYESTRVSGSFSEQGFTYRFSLTISPAPGGEMDKADMDGRRAQMIDASGLRGDATRLETVRSGTGAAERILYFERRGEATLPVYEREEQRSTSAGVTDRVVLHVWPARRADTAAGQLLVQATHDPTRAPRLRFDLRRQPAAPRSKRNTITPEPEESKMPWSIRLLDQQTSVPLAGCPYKLVRDGKTMFQGRADRNGFTMTQNVDYFEQGWKVDMPAPSKRPCVVQR